MLPACVPAGERWQQCIANRTFKSRVIQLVIHRLTTTLTHALSDSQSLIVDYMGPPARFSKACPLGAPMEGMLSLGEADVKFMRYADMYEKLQVDSVDGDSIPIALLHMERGGLGDISVLRLETRLKEQKQAAKKIKLETAVAVAGSASASASASAPARKQGRVYEYVNVRLLYDALRYMVIPQCTSRVAITSHVGHEMSMLVCLIGLSGTDFTRGLPLVSGKTIYDYMPDLWSRLARAYNPLTRQLMPEAALDQVISTIYKRKFERHSGGAGSLAATLACIKGSEKLSSKTRDRLPSAETLHCTVRNVNWLLCYWHQPDYPDPVQPQFGFAKDKKGVRFES